MGVGAQILSSFQEPKNLCHRTPFQYVGMFSGHLYLKLVFYGGECTWAFVVKKIKFCFKKKIRIVLGLNV